MTKDFAKRFYKSKSWKNTRAAYFASQQGLCERCRSFGKLVPGEIVHHKQHLTPLNINNPNISLSFDNLELLCRECHAAEHPEAGFQNKAKEKTRVAFDVYGNVVPIAGEQKENNGEKDV